MTYLANYSLKKLSFQQEYLHQGRMQREDFTRNVPDKRMEKLRMPSGLYGYTYLGLDYMAINDSLTPEESYKTQVHEAIHTPIEYETRVLTEWMLDFMKKRNYEHSIFIQGKDELKIN